MANPLNARAASPTTGGKENASIVGPERLSDAVPLTEPPTSPAALIEGPLSVDDAVPVTTGVPEATSVGPANVPAADPETTGVPDAAIVGLPRVAVPVPVTIEVPAALMVGPANPSDAVDEMTGVPLAEIVGPESVSEAVPLTLPPPPLWRSTSNPAAPLSRSWTSKATNHLGQALGAGWRTLMRTRITRSSVASTATL